MSYRTQNKLSSFLVGVHRKLQFFSRLHLCSRGLLSGEGAWLKSTAARRQHGQYHHGDYSIQYHLVVSIRVDVVIVLFLYNYYTSYIIVTLIS